jgi:hypothetical protein
MATGDNVLVWSPRDLDKTTDSYFQDIRRSERYRIILSESERDFYPYFQRIYAAFVKTYL